MAPPRSRKPAPKKKKAAPNRARRPAAAPRKKKVRAMPVASKPPAENAAALALARSMAQAVVDKKAIAVVILDVRGHHSKDEPGRAGRVEEARRRGGRHAGAAGRARCAGGAR